MILATGLPMLVFPCMSCIAKAWLGAIVCVQFTWILNDFLELLVLRVNQNKYLSIF